MEDCLFCKIIKGEIPSKKAYEDENVYAFWDIAPTAPVHILVIPKKHIATLNDVNGENADVIAKIYEAIPKIAKENGIAEDGYRVVSNCNQAAGQTVFHIHFHLLGGRELTWPAG
ncbi:MAG: histidine triad nucleotide-binding protein [Ruminococcaceae bacterium]|nr:histidine triad nucleotide-binding protein [Oscillospiraceae bacterium]